MMKLRAKQFKADTSIFLMMIKVFGACILFQREESMMSLEEIRDQTKCVRTCADGAGRRLRHDLDRGFG
jgi:hypothetical protein